MTAYEQGVQAYEDYENSSSNPYPDKDEDHYDWLNGYCDQRAIDKGDIDYEPKAT